MRAASRLALATLLLGPACAEDRQPQAPADTGSSTGAGGSSSSGAAMPDLGAAESTGPSWPLPSDDDMLTCVRSCEGPWDCCPPGSTGQCPGPAYPYNYMCIEGMCVFPPCTSAADCPGDGEQCVQVRGTPTCVLPCDGDDAPCAAVDTDLSCSATADDGSPYCFAHCTSPSVFCGIATCDEASGVCMCSSSGQCLDQWICV
ncbi:MAG: hypothetical protein AB1Z98_15060 [Nannocystaceae bacterium]